MEPINNQNINETSQSEPIINHNSNDSNQSESIEAKQNEVTRPKLSFQAVFQEPTGVSSSSSSSSLPSAPSINMKELMLPLFQMQKTALANQVHELKRQRVEKTLHKI